MTRKAIFLINSDEQVKSICLEGKAQADMLIEQASFISKQMDDILKKRNELSKTMWEKLEARLKELKALPSDYDDKKHNLLFDHKTMDAIFMDDLEDTKGGIPEFLKNLFFS